LHNIQFFLTIDADLHEEIHGPASPDRSPIVNKTIHMKKLIYILVFLFPVIAFAQQPWYKPSPLDFAWKNVGNAGFSSGAADYTSLALSPIGQPYVAYSDGGNSWKATVKKFSPN